MNSTNNKESKISARRIATPGEVIVSGGNFLPGEGTEKIGEEILALKYGIVEESNGLVKIISISGVYYPRSGNVVIGMVENITFNGWVIDIETHENAFLSLAEVPRYVNKDEIEDVMNIGDMVVAKIWSINKRGIDLSIKSKGLGKINDGIIIKVNSNKVPRIIGKDGSMVNLIKSETECNITVGQNGLIWIRGEKIENELFAKRAILFVAEKSFIVGLTDEVKKWLEEEKTK